MFTSRLRPFLDRFKFRACFSMSSTFHSLENLVIARCFPNFSAHLVKFSQLKFCKSVQFANIVKILLCEKFPALRYVRILGLNLFVLKVYICSIEYSRLI